MKLRSQEKFYIALEIIDLEIIDYYDHYSSERIINFWKINE